MQKLFGMTLFRTEYFQLEFIAINSRCWLLQGMLQPAGKRKGYSDGKWEAGGLQHHIFHLRDATKEGGKIQILWLQNKKELKTGGEIRFPSRILFRF